MREEDVATDSGGVRLAGTLTRPEGTGPYPVALFLHGTGPLDRNENSPGQRLDIFRDLARALAGAGYASLRWDKRGCGASGGDYLRHGLDDLVVDAAAWLEYCAAQDGLAPPVLIGHSEGTLIAPLVARTRRDVAAMVLICPFAGKTIPLLRAQAREMAEALGRMRGLKGWILRAAAWATGGPERRQEREIVRLMSSTAPVLRIGLRRVPARSLRDLMQADPMAVHAAHRIPTLALAAGADIQCDPGDAARIAGVNPAVTAQVLPGVSHLLRRVEGRGGFETYPAQIGREIAPEVAGAVISWLDWQTGRA